MASKRVPLQSNPNAINSPLRPSATGKRPRVQGTEQRGQELDQAPPKKRQALDGQHQGLRRTQALSLNERDGKVFEAKTQHIHPNDFQRRLTTAPQARTKEQDDGAVEKEERLRLTDKEQVKTWRRHYQKVFPSFVFYFESLPHDAASTASRAIAHLGAREEKFFSRNVTHIVTTRPIPHSVHDTESTRSSSSKGIHPQTQTQSSQTRTINPSLLEKQADPQWKASAPKSRLVTDMLNQRRPQMAVIENETRRQQPSSADILIKAKEMGMKIWPLEKFERMLNTLLALETDEPEAPMVRKATGGIGQAKHGAPEQDLSQLLRQEKNMPSDRPPWSDVVSFRAFYVYVHDVEEIHKPVMVREYNKPNEKEEGEWPQLHSVQAPRCPFVVDSGSKRSEAEKEASALAAAQKHPEAARTRAASAAIDSTKARIAENRTRVAPKTRPTEAEQPSKHAKAEEPVAQSTRTFEPPQCKQSTNSVSDSLPAHLSNRFHFQGIRRPNAGLEPLASGLQQSKPTSAIHSHMISSTAANPPTRLGNSKEIHELQRRAVVQRRSGLSANSVTSEYANDIRAALNKDSNPGVGHSVRRKAHEPMAKIYEDETQSEDDEEDTTDPGHQSGPSKAPRKKKAQRREPKAGYCENCRDKYDDFNEHILSKKHRKFATAGENFTDLDALLKKLARK